MRKLLVVIVGALLLPACLLYSQTDNEAAPLSPEEQAYQHLLQAVDTGNPQAIWHLARLLETGSDFVAADTVRALALYRQLADSDYAPALNYMGRLIWEGRLGLEQSFEEALPYIVKAAELGDLTAATNLGYIYSNPSPPTLPDYDKALYWLEKATASGSHLPLEAMAGIYELRGDTVAAVEALEKAALHGSQSAPFRLLDLNRATYEAMDVDTLMQTALRYYHHGSPLTGLSLMWMAEERPDLPQADQALIKAIRAQLTSQGYLLPYDYEASLRLFYEAALLGDPSAQFIVAETLDVTPDAFSELGGDSQELGGRSEELGVNAREPECGCKDPEGRCQQPERRCKESGSGCKESGSGCKESGRGCKESGSGCQEAENGCQETVETGRLLSAEELREAAAAKGVTNSRTAIARLLP